MTIEDVSIIFSNIEELAEFSIGFCDLLKQALGSAIPPSIQDDGTQQQEEIEDCVGQLFLQIIPSMERPYK
jgi:dynamin-binding protein